MPDPGLLEPSAAKSTFVLYPSGLHLSPEPKGAVVVVVGALKHRKLLGSEVLGGGRALDRGTRICTVVSYTLL